MIVWSSLSSPFGRPQFNLMTSCCRRSAASTILHTARTIYKHLHPWHFLSPVLHLCGFCLGPPWSALAMPGSPCLYLCHRNNPKECLWQVNCRYWLLLLDWGCLHGCMNRQANTSHSNWQHTLVSYWSSNQNIVLMYWGRDLCDMSACSGAHGPVFFYSIWTIVNVYTPYRPHVVPLVYVILFKGVLGGGKLKPCSCP